MTRAKQWTVDIVIDERDDERRTRAEARLQLPDRSGLVGCGTARRNPADPRVPQIGDELAVSRALADLAHSLLEAAGDNGRGTWEGTDRSCRPALFRGGSLAGHHRLGEDVTAA